MDVEPFEFAADTTKQILTLCAAILTLTVTFAKDRLVADGNRFPISLCLSWVFFLISILAGIWTMGALTGELNSKRHETPNIFGSNVVLPSAIQWLTFALGIILTVLAGWSAVRQRRTPSS